MENNINTEQDTNIEIETIILKEIKEVVCDNNICKVYYYHVKINNVKQKAIAMRNQFIDESWLSKIIDEGDIESFKVCSEKTIKMLIKILNSVDSQIGKEFGEYIISSTALTTLQNEQEHEPLPLAEIWKEQESKNPGFDFHTISKDEILLYGEAKYRSKSNAYGESIKSIKDFIKNKKDKAELHQLKLLNSRITNNHYNIDKKGFIAAFSIRNNFNDIFKTILNNKHIHDNKLFKYPEWYFIGVEICH